MELAGAAPQLQIGTDLEGAHDGAPDAPVTGELGEVLVGEIGSAAQFTVGDQAEDGGSLTLASFHGSSIVVVADGSLSTR
jgi:hypothetical protein